MTIPLDQATESKLDELARRTHRSRADVAAQAVEVYLDVQAWQIAEIERAIVEADGGDFATDEELGEAVKRWTS